MDRLPTDLFARRGEERLAECPEHGPFTSRNIVRNIWSRCPQCDEARRAAEAAEADAREAKRREEAHRAMLGAAAIPTRFVGRAFDNFKADSDAKTQALTVCRDYAEDFEANAKRGAGLVLSGAPGTGKSHLAAAILQHHMRRDVRYCTCLDMIRSIRDTWRRDSERSETQVLRYLEELDLLVIDEVGMQYGTDGEQTIIFDVLDRRYREVRPTIIITNQDKKGLREFVGDRTFDRIVETCRWVPFDWPSYRPQARKEAA